MLLAALPVAIGRASAVGETFEEVLRYGFPRLYRLSNNSNFRAKGKKEGIWSFH
jgi:hypothetical protein